MLIKDVCGKKNAQLRAIMKRLDAIASLIKSLVHFLYSLREYYYMF